MEREVLVEGAGPVATVILNALSPAMPEALRDDPVVRVAVPTSASRAFSAGFLDR